MLQTAQAASYALPLQTMPTGNVVGFFGAPAYGAFRHSFAFVLPRQSALLVAVGDGGGDVSHPVLAQSIDGLRLSLFRETAYGAEDLPVLRTSEVLPNSETREIRYDDAGARLDARTSYYLEVSGHAPVGLALGGSLNVQPIPLPAALPLLGAALVGLWGARPPAPG